MPPLSRARRLRRRTLVLLPVLALLGASTAHAAAKPPSVTVMTQNIYQGTEFRNSALLGFVNASPTLEDFVAATSADYATYLATRFSDRATAIAKEIARNRPALVGLQEVATWHKGPFDSANPLAMPVAVSEDFLAELIAALAAQGMHYARVVVHNGNFAVSGPADVPGAGRIGVGMVEGGAIIARTDLPASRLKLSNPRSGTYKTLGVRIPNAFTGGLQLTESWLSVDAKVAGKKFRFVTTHLESFSQALAAGQARDLLKGPGKTSLPLVVTGDFNSAPGEAAYKAVVAGGLADTWRVAHPRSAGFTCCHLAPNDLSTDPAEKYTQRLDHIFTRGALRVGETHLVGDKVADMTPGSPALWPSDHAGVVATLRLAAPAKKRR